MINVELIKSKIKENNLSIIDISNLTNIKYSELIDILNGVKTNNTLAIMRICNLLNIDYNDFFIYKEKEVFKYDNITVTVLYPEEKQKLQDKLTLLVAKQVKEMLSEVSSDLKYCVEALKNKLEES